MRDRDVPAGEALDRTASSNSQPERQANSLADHSSIGSPVTAGMLTGR